MSSGYVSSGPAIITTSELRRRTAWRARIRNVSGVS
jgi:hypothetical protein